MATEIWNEQTWPDELYGKLLLSTEKCSLRLLRVLPGSDEDPIRCKLFRTTLVSSPPYEALSYTWGESVERRSILVNGFDVLITTNLEIALRNLRQRSVPRVLWIDALCINQHDIAERSSQVREMGEIYGSAERVIVWLGEPVKNHQLIKIASTQSRESTRPICGVRSDNLGCELRFALRELLMRPWWRRVWVVQEVSRARQDPVFILNHQNSISLSALETLAATHRDEDYVSGLQTIVGIRRRTRLPPRLREPESGESLVIAARKRLGQDLHYLLGATRAFRATDPRDNIFALWTLMRGTGSQRFKPDYNMTVQQVYTAVTAQVIKGLDSTDILSLRWGKPGQGLPSWVPDYSVAPVSLPNFPVPRDLTSFVTKTASRHRSPHIEHTVLHVQAGIFDTVASVYTCEPFKDLDNRASAFDRDAEERLAKIQDETALLAEMEPLASVEDQDLLIQRRQRLLRKRLDHEKIAAGLKAEIDSLLNEQRFFAKAIVNFAALLDRTDAEREPCLGSRLSGKYRVKQASLGHSAIGQAWLIIFERERLAYEAMERTLEKFSNIADLKTWSNFVRRAETKSAEVRTLIRRLGDLEITTERLIKACIPRSRNEDLAFRQTLTLRKLKTEVDWPNATGSQRARLAREIISELPDSVWGELATIMQEIEGEARAEDLLCDQPDFGHLAMFKTHSGITGFASEDLQVGDSLAIIHGLPTVSVLRRIESGQDRFEFRGKAFVELPEDLDAIWQQLSDSFSQSDGTTIEIV